MSPLHLRHLPSSLYLYEQTYLARVAMLAIGPRAARVSWLAAASRQFSLKITQGGADDLGWTTPAQWFNYTVDVATAGTYTISMRLAAPTDRGGVPCRVILEYGHRSSARLTRSSRHAGINPHKPPQAVRRGPRRPRDSSGRRGACSRALPEVGLLRVLHCRIEQCCSGRASGCCCRGVPVHAR